MPKEEREPHPGRQEEKQRRGWCMLGARDGRRGTWGGYRIFSSEKGALPSASIVAVSLSEIPNPSTGGPRNEILVQ